MSRRAEAARGINPGPCVAALLFGLLAPAAAQIAPRLTGTAVIEQLEIAQHDLGVRAVALPQSSLTATSERLGQLAAALRQTLGVDAGKPLDIIDTQAKARAYRAYAAAQRAEAYLAASKGCLDGDATAMAEALAGTVDRLARAADASKLQPVINAVETPDHRPLFVLRSGDKPVAFALVGDNLFDAQCVDPVVTATDQQGRPQAAQPAVTGVLANRIELKLPGTAELHAGSYVLHVVTRRKAFLLGCAAQPEAVAVLQVAPVEQVSVSYAVTATCRANAGGKPGERSLLPVTGIFPQAGSGAVSQHVASDGCADPISYSITAKVTFGDGHSASIGPISQSAAAGITAGLPGGLSLSWDPSVRELFVRPAASTCKGID